MTETKLNEKYAKLLVNLDFERLDLILRKPNIFSALNIAHYEIRHSNFLGWLLDPTGNHGLNDIFLKRILIHLLVDNRSKNVSPIQIPKLLSQSILIHREWHNIDILIEFDDTVIAIENKIASSEHSNQLERYFKVVEEAFPNKRKVLCYLTPFGNNSSMSSHYIELGYQQIVTDLEDILTLYRSSLNNKVVTYLEDYLDNLQMNVIEESNANELAREIYKNHKELLEFIFEHRPDAASDFLPIIQKYFEDKGFKIGSPNKGVVRFLSPTLYNNLKPYDKNFGGFPKKEPFLFEVDFFWTPGKIIFKVIVTPSDYEIKNVICNLIEEIDGAKKPSGKKWAGYFITKQNFKLSDSLEQTEVEIVKELDKFYNSISPIIKRVENKLSQNLDLILQHIDY
ncbi:PD-(D/E)XK nuclease family protein [Sphingobacterium lactis]|uniref:PDDEXK-like family protein n=1 Tax=Sphingobacterium lactis TaxID=797291 RepID=UPI003DA6883D